MTYSPPVDPDEFAKVRACRTRILTVLSEGEMSRTALVRRCTAHPQERFRHTLDMMIEGGEVGIRLEGLGRRAATMIALRKREIEAPDPMMVRMTQEAVDAQREAVSRLQGWFGQLETDKTNTLLWSARKPMLLAARDILVLMHRTPWKYGHDVQVWAVLEDVAETYGLTRARKALRHLAGMGAVVLTERKGRKRPTTVRLAWIPPYPVN